MEDDIPHGWAGQLWISASFDEVYMWCTANMEKHNYDITQYDTNLCLLAIRKPKDLIISTLKWE